jgi:hypothetical protein
LKKCGEVEVQSHVILISALGTGEWPVSLPGTLGYETLGVRDIPVAEAKKRIPAENLSPFIQHVHTAVRGHDNLRHHIVKH